jgi:hypothetical protein
MSKQGFLYDDGGRSAAGYQGAAGDCVCRSIAIATRRPYQEVYDALNALGAQERTGKRKRGKSSARLGVYKNAIRKYMASIGWRWVPTMQIGQGCTVHLCAEELPAGHLVVNVSKHVTAMIDGVIRDTHDPRRDIHCIDPDHGQPLKPGQWRNTNGICSIRRRCVYGYFIAPEAA